MVEVVEERSIRIEGVPGGMLERMEVIIPALVATMRVRNLHTESLRFPGQG